MFMATSKLPIFQKVHLRSRKFSMKGLQKNLHKGDYSKLIDNGLYISGLKIGGRMVASCELKLTRATKS